MVFKICTMEIRGGIPPWWHHSKTAIFSTLRPLPSVWFSVPHSHLPDPQCWWSQCLYKSPWQSTNGFSVTFFFGDNRNLVHKVLSILGGWGHEMSPCLKNHLVWLSVLYPSIISFVYKVNYKLLRLAYEVLHDWVPASVTSSHTCLVLNPTLWSLPLHFEGCADLCLCSSGHAPPSIYNAHLHLAHVVNLYSPSKLCSTTFSSMKPSCLPK